MLIENEKVKTRWNYSTKKHYIEKGYEYTKVGDELWVYPNDLTSSSDVMVKVKCDYCGIVYEMAYKKYTKRVLNNENGVNKCACKNCNTKKTREVNINKYGVESWTSSEEGRQFVGNSKKKYDIEFVKNEFEKEGYTLVTEEYVNTSQRLDYICPKHGMKHTTFNHFYNNKKRCDECFYERNSGENNNSWNGGTTELNDYLRESLKEWKVKSLEHYGYKCVITGEVGGELEIHHRTPFNEIVYKTMKNLGYEYNNLQINRFNEEELELIKNKFLEFSMQELGYPLRKYIHREFHNIYGLKVSAEDFDDYVYRKENNMGFEDVSKKRFRNKPFIMLYNNKEYRFETRKELEKDSQSILGFKLTFKRISDILNNKKIIYDNNGNKIEMYFL